MHGLLRWHSGRGICLSMKEMAGEPNLIPSSGRSPARGNGNLLQYSCLKNPMDSGAWQAIVNEFTKSKTLLSTHAKL